MAKSASGLTFTPRTGYCNLLGPGRHRWNSTCRHSRAGRLSQRRDGSRGKWLVSDRLSAAMELHCSQPADRHRFNRAGLTVIIGPPNFKLFVYTVKFLCGEQRDNDCGCAPVLPGRYATEINIHNWQNQTVLVAKGASFLLGACGRGGGTPNRFARSDGKTRFDQAAGAQRHHGRLLPAAGDASWRDAIGPTSLNLGFLEIISSRQLSVTAVYTAGWKRASAVHRLTTDRGAILTI